MSFVLVVEPDARSAGRIEEALRSEGWQIKVVADPSEALRLAAAQAPRLVVVNGELAEARELLRYFARRRGGPGAVGLVPEGLAAGRAAELGADELVKKPFAAQDLKMAIQRCLSSVRTAGAPAAGDKVPRLSSSDLFGDVLAEIGGEEPRSAPAPRPVGDADLQRRLDDTLSGILPAERGAARAAATGQRRPGGGSPRDVNDLLDRTLADLQISAWPRKGGTSPGVGSPAESSAVAPTPAAAEPAAPPAPPAPAPRTPSTAPARTRGSSDFGPYTLEERIAVGGMAEVWKARMKGFEGFQKTVAIKRILPHLTSSEDFVTMFVDEAKLAAQLNHNNIIQIYDLGKVGGEYYIAMEHVEGHDLRAVLRAARRRGQPMPLGLALHIAARLADALQYAHRKRDFDNRELGLVHRDVSPQNVLISTEGEIKLCDFGIAKAVSKVSETQMGALKGKLQYMSPEQAWGRGVDPRSDIFSLGALLFEMLTGEPLFAGDSEMLVLEQVRQSNVRDPRALNPEVPPSVARIVLRALQKDPPARYPNAQEMLQALDAELKALPRPPGRQDLARYVTELAAAEPVEPESEPGVAGPAAVLGSERPAETAAAPPEPTPVRPAPGLEVPALEPVGELEPEPDNQRSRLLLIAAIVVAVIAAGVGYMVLGRSTPPPPPATDAVPAAALPVGETGEPTPADVQAAEGETPVEADGVEPAVVAPATEAANPGLSGGGEASHPAPVKAEPPGGGGTSPAPQVAKDTPPPPTTSGAAKAPAAEVPPSQQARTPEPKAVPPPSDKPPEPPAKEPAVGTPDAPQPSSGPAGTDEPAAVAKEAATPPANKPPVKVASPPVAAQTTKRGDLVMAGPGVTPPRLVAFDKPQYPPLARRLKVEGTVVAQVLVDENGAVIEVTLTHGVSQNVGINEAVEEAARKARFEPATKDGVQVKMVYNLVVPFKL